MKVSCNLQSFSKAIQIAERVVGKKESLPVLSCIVITAHSDKKKITITSTNLETAVELQVQAEITESGSIAVPVTILSQTIRALHGESLEMTVTGTNNLTIRAKQSTTTLNTVSIDEFPSIPKESDTEAHTLPKQELIKGIQTVSYAASTSMIRPELASIFISYNKKKLTFAATDSFRLAEKVIPLELKGEFPDVLLPVKNALEIVHILSNIEDETIECRFDESQISIKARNLYAVSRIIDATFPQYQAIIPEKFVSEATLLKEDFSSVIKKARIFSQASQQISFQVYPSKKRLALTARTADVGETVDEIEAVLSGEDLDINFNLHYLSDCLQSISSDSISLQFAGMGKPLVLKGIGDNSFLYLVMPLNR